jgi:uncharacterized membrane protein YcaP (DUF421 family)
MEPYELAMTAARAAGVFFLMLVVIRLLGKRTVGNLSAFDLLVALMLGEVVDEMIYGDVPLVQGAVAIGVIAVAKYGTNLLAYVSKTLSALLEGKPTVLVKDGEFQRKGMRSELMSEEEVMSALRLQGSVEDVKDVKLAMVEPDGLVSVIRTREAEEAQRRDVERLNDRLTKRSA